MWSDPDADDEDDRYPYAPPPPRRYVDRARDRGAAPVDGRGAPQPGPKPPKDDGNALFGPAWERPRRYEAYPTLRSRMSVSVPLPGLSRVVLALGALALGVLVLFFLPGMLDLGGGGSGSGPTATSSSLASQTPEPSPTATPAPTPIVHVVAQGETLSKIAKRYGLTLDQVLAANPQIKNPNKIAIGDEIKIPTPPPSDDLGASQEPSAS
jgi:nucleoid-associated protein YgaU